MIPGIAGAVGKLGPPFGASVTLSDQDIYVSGETGAPTAGYSIASDGKAKDGLGAILETWLGAGGNAASYQARASLSSGVTPAGTLNAWLSLSSSQSWSVSRGTVGANSAVLIVSIRDAPAPNTVRATATITLTAEKLDSGGSTMTL